MSLVNVSISAPSTAEPGQAFIVSGTVFEGPAPLMLGPIAGATVTIYQNGTSKGTATTDGAGFYSKSITINQAGTFGLRATALGVWSGIDYITITAPPDPPVIKSVTISAPSSAEKNTSFTISGTVRDQYGDGFSGATVSLYDNQSLFTTVITNSVGGYTKSHSISSSGSHELLAISGGRYASRTIIITEPAPEPPYVNSVTISAPTSRYENEAFTITGRVLDQYGVAMEGVTVYLQRNGVSIGSDATNSTGYYSKSHSISTAGVYTLRAIADSKSASRNITIIEVAVGIPTTTTLSAPSKAGVGEKFNVSGILYETEAGIPIPNQPINHSYNGRSLGSSTTGVDGQYLKEVSVPESGVWTLKSEFPGTEGLQASRATVDAVVAATPIVTALLIAGPIATALALFACVSS